MRSFEVENRLKIRYFPHTMTAAVAKVKAEIENLSLEERDELLSEFGWIEEPNFESPETEASIARGEADIEAGRVYTLEDVIQYLRES